MATRHLCSGSRLACSLLAGLAFISPATHAQAPPIPPDVTTLLAQAGAFTPDDAATLESGRVLVKTQTAPENLEASVVAAVRIATTRDRALEYFRTLVSYVDGQVTQQFGNFSPTASESDVRLLTLDSADITDLRSCQASSCEIRIGAASITDIAAAADWRDPDVADRANAWMRRQLAAYANNYLRLGDVALVTYDDHAAPVNLQAQWQSFVSRASLSTLAPRLQRYLAEYPGFPASEAKDEMYWDKQHYTGLKPVIGLTQMITWADPATPGRVLIAQKQIHASHYFFGSLAVTLILQEAGSPQPATWVVYTNRTRGDLLRTAQPSSTAGQGALAGIRARVAGLGSSVQRRLGEEMIKQSADRLLSAMKQALER